jgi:hypothetical protein
LQPRQSTAFNSSLVYPKFETFAFYEAMGSLLHNHIRKKYAIVCFDIENRYLPDPGMYGKSVTYCKVVLFRGLEPINHCTERLYILKSTIVLFNIDLLFDFGSLLVMP